MYNGTLKYKWDNRNVLDYAVSKAEAQGIEIGIGKGIEQGIEQGEHKKALAVASAFKKMGLSVEDIAKGTGLSVEEIEKL